MAVLAPCWIDACLNQRNDEIQCPQESRNEKFAKPNFHSIPPPERTDGLERAKKRRPWTGPSQARTIDGVNVQLNASRRRSRLSCAPGFCSCVTHQALHSGTRVCPSETASRYCDSERHRVRIGANAAHIHVA